MSRYYLMVDNNIVAATRDYSMLLAYRELKDGIGELEVPTKKEYKKFLSQYPDYELEETELGFPLTHREVMYVDYIIGSTEPIIKNALNSIKRAMRIVSDGDAKHLFKAAKILLRYSGSHNKDMVTSREDLMGVLSNIYIPGDSDNIIEETLKLMDHWRKF